MYTFNINYYVGIDNVKLFPIVINIYGIVWYASQQKMFKEKYSR